MKFHLYIMFWNSFNKLPGDETAQLSRFDLKALNVLRVQNQ